jgi:hypothetical protein
VRLFVRVGTNLEADLVSRALDPLEAADNAEPVLELAVPIGASLFDGRIEVDDLIANADLVRRRPNGQRGLTRGRLRCCRCLALDDGGVAALDGFVDHALAPGLNDLAQALDENGLDTFVEVRYPRIEIRVAFEVQSVDLCGAHMRQKRQLPRSARTVF